MKSPLLLIAEEIVARCDNVNRKEVRPSIQSAASCRIELRRQGRIPDMPLAEADARIYRELIRSAKVH